MHSYLTGPIKHYRCKPCCLKSSVFSPTFWFYSTYIFMRIVELIGTQFEDCKFGACLFSYKGACSDILYDLSWFYINIILKIMSTWKQFGFMLFLCFTFANGFLYINILRGIVQFFRIQFNAFHDGNHSTELNFKFQLTAHNWQKWKRVFLTRHCYKIYSMDEAVGLKSCKYTWKITIFVKMWDLGQYREDLIFCQ